MKKIIGALLVVALIGGVVAYKMYNKPHRDIDAEQAVATMSAGELFNLYESHEDSANTLYLDKVVEVTGTISELSENSAGGARPPIATWLLSVPVQPTAFAEFPAPTG